MTIRILKSAREKHQVTYNGEPTIAQQKPRRPGKNRMAYSKYQNKNIATRNSIPSKPILQNRKRNKILSFFNKQN